MIYCYLPIKNGHFPLQPVRLSQGLRGAKPFTKAAAAIPETKARPLLRSPISMLVTLFMADETSKLGLGLLALQG